ncbi:MAG TPA: DsbA family oxidoreductase [Ureibacillus sp.]|nr:DsbA family oxidoreductase [Ureibacillus sp.]
MKIEVWSDYVCPFCYIGKRQLEKSIKDSGFEGQIEVELKSFLLDPTTPLDTNNSVYASLSKKFNISENQAKEMTKNVAERAKEVGLQYNFDFMKEANTTSAHRLAKWANTKGKGEQLSERILQSYFLEGGAIGKQEVLLNLVEEVGLDKEEALEVLKSEKFVDKVEQDISEAQNLGVRGVPFFVIDNKYGISGAQPKDVFDQAITKAADEAGLKPRIKMVGESGEICADGQCDL